MTRTRSASRREGFTLVELLTVIGIISLLISILLPSLSKARDQAKKVAVKAQLDAMGKGLEMFQNDFNQYPDSTLGKDPIDWTVTSPPNAPPKDAIMTGAHWMARAMIGHDFQGIDTQSVMLKRPPNPLGTWVAPTFDSFVSSLTPPGLYSERKGTYLDPKVFIRDDDQVKFPGAPVATTTPPTIGRLVVADGYNFPVLYYRANPRARNPFDIGTANAAGSSTSTGVYSQADNAPWTGADSSAATPYASYDFANAGSAHGLGKFLEGGTGNAGVPGDYTGSVANLARLDVKAGGTNTLTSGPAVPFKGKTFAGYFHSEATHTAGNTASAVNPETFVLISAGKDGIYGTDDDVNNFTGGL